MSTYAIILDVVMILIAAFFIIRAFKCGLIKSLFLMVGYLLAIVCAIYFSQYFSKSIFKNILRDNIINSVNSQISQTLSSQDKKESTSNENNNYAIKDIPNEEKSEIDVSFAVVTLLESLPKYVRNGINVFFGGEEQVLNKFVGETVQKSVIIITDDIIAPIAISLMQFLLCIIIFIICVFIIRIIGRALNIFQKIPVIGTVNAVLGGFVGALQAIIFLILLAMCAKFIISCTGGTLKWLNNDIISDTFIFKSFFDLKFI